MSVAKANKVLKSLGMGRVKMQKDYSGWNTKCYKDWDGSMVNGIELRSHSPMDCTNVPFEQIARKMTEIDNVLQFGSFPMRKDGERYIVAETARTITYLTISKERYPTYTRSMNLDSGYETTYAVPIFTKESK